MQPFEKKHVLFFERKGVPFWEGCVFENLDNDKMSYNGFGISFVEKISELFN